MPVERWAKTKKMSQITSNVLMNVDREKYDEILSQMSTIPSPDYGWLGYWNLSLTSEREEVITIAIEDYNEDSEIEAVGSCWFPFGSPEKYEMTKF